MFVIFVTILTNVFIAFYRNNATSLHIKIRIMQKYLFTILLISLSTLCFAQTKTDFSSIRLENEEDYKKSEATVLDASDYILSTPVEAENKQRIYAIQFILAWMEGTPDYKFSLDDLDKLDNDVNQSTVFLAALAKYTIENKSLTEEADYKGIRDGAFRLFLKYAINSENNLNKKTKLKKLIKAYNSNELSKELDK